MSDWLDDEVPIEWLADLLQLIHGTPNLDWQLLTKRPENWGHRVNYAAAYLLAAKLPAGEAIAQWTTGHPLRNVWIGTTVENQEMADKRIPQLLQIPAAVRFLSCEPLLGELFPCFECDDPDDDNPGGKVFRSALHPGFGMKLIHWVICGGESGRIAQPMHPDWARYLRDQCAAAGVPFFFKQWGEWAPLPDGVDSMDKPWSDVSYGEYHGGTNWIDSCMCSEGDETLYRVGKKLAGAILDGVEHKAFPEVSAHAV